MNKDYSNGHKRELISIFVYYKYCLLKKSVYCVSNVFLHLLVSKSFVTFLISLFKYKLFRKIIVSILLHRFLHLFITSTSFLKMSFYFISNVYLYLLVSKSLVTSLPSLIKYKLVRQMIVSTSLYHFPILEYFCVSINNDLVEDRFSFAFMPTFELPFL